MKFEFIIIFLVAAVCCHVTSFAKTEEIDSDCIKYINSPVDNKSGWTVRRTQSYKPYTIHSSRLNSDITSSDIERAILCKPLEANVVFTACLFNYFDIKGSQGDGILSITRFSGAVNGRKTEVSLYSDKDKSVLNNISVGGRITATCDFNGQPNVAYSYLEKEAVHQSKAEDLPAVRPHELDSPVSDDCKQLFQARIFNRLVERVCKFTGGVANAVGAVLKRECPNLSEEDGKKWLIQVAEAVTNDLKKMGVEKACKVYKIGYDVLAKDK